MNKIRLMILLAILPFLAFITNVKAINWDYEFTGYNKANQLQFGLYNDTTLIQNALTSCTSSNDGYCAFENEELPSGDLVFNNLRFVIRGTDGTSFSAGSQYKLSFFFGSTTSDYYITQNTLTNTTGVSYQNFTNWTSNDLSIISSNIVPIETVTYSGISSTLYRVDLTVVVSSSTVSGFSIRLYRSAKTTYASTPVYLDLFRYFSVTQMTPGSIDYTQDFNNVINNQNENTQDIIDNQNENTQDIIDNQNNNTQAIIDSNLSCQKTIVNKDSIVIHDSLLIGPGTIQSYQGYGITDYFRFSNTRFLKLRDKRIGYGGRFFCFYDSDKNLIGSCISPQNIDIGSTISVPSNAVYARFTIEESANLPQFEIEACKNGSQAINDSLTDDDVSGANSSASNFFSNFTTETYGLTSVITSPLTFIQSLTSKTCSSLVLPLPYVNRNLELPCMRGIYEQHFGGFLSIYQTITFGIISYWVVVRIFNLVKDFKNPDHDEIEVMDL